MDHIESKFEIDLEPTLEGLVYATRSPNQVLDLYLPADMASCPPLVVAIHGGRFSLGNRRWELAHVPSLLEGGWAVASIEYRLAQEAKFPAAVQDCKAAVRWLRSHAGEFGYDPDRFIAWGRSAGGTLAALVGATGSARTRLDEKRPTENHSASVQAVIDWYGLSDFSQASNQFREQRLTGENLPLVDLDGADSPISVWLGAPASSVPDLVAEASPITYVRSRQGTLPPFFIATGDADLKVPYKQSVVLAEALRGEGVDIELHILPGVGHGAIEIEQQLTPVAMEWLADRGLAPK